MKDQNLQLSAFFTPRAKLIKQMLDKLYLNLIIAIIWAIIGMTGLIAGLTYVIRELLTVTFTDLIRLSTIYWRILTIIFIVIGFTYTSKNKHLFNSKLFWFLLTPFYFIYILVLFAFAPLISSIENLRLNKDIKQKSLIDVSDTVIDKKDLDTRYTIFRYQIELKKYNKPVFVDKNLYKQIKIGDKIYLKVYKRSGVVRSWTKIY